MGGSRSASVAEATPAPLLTQSPVLDRLRAGANLLAQTHVRWLIVILIAALAVRVAWVVAVQPDPRDGRFDDTVWYYSTAQHLMDGDGYVFPGDAFCARGGIGCDETPPTALWAPGYPLTLAALFQLPGDDVAWARALNVAAGLALVAGVYYLGSRLWDRRAGLFGAAIIALFPGHVFFSSLVLTEPLFTALAVGVLCLTVAWTLGRDAAHLRVVALGLAAGALAMVRPEGIVFVAVIVGTWLLVHRSWRRVAAYTGLLALGMAVLFVPWTVRNAIQLDAPIAGTTGLGQVLIQAHHEAADGYPKYWIANELWLRYEDVPLPEREIRINNTGLRESLEYAVDHPGRELELMPQRFAAFYRGDRGALVWNRVDNPNGERAISLDAADSWGIVSDAYYYAVLGVALFALPFWLRRSRGQHLLLWGPIAIYSAMWFFLFVGESRYHVPLLPVFALLAGVGLAAVSQRLSPGD